MQPVDMGKGRVGAFSDTVLHTRDAPPWGKPMRAPSAVPGLAMGPGANRTHKMASPRGPMRKRSGTCLALHGWARPAGRAVR